MSAVNHTSKFGDFPIPDSELITSQDATRIGNELVAAGMKGPFKLVQWINPNLDEVVIYSSDEQRRLFQLIFADNAVVDAALAKSLQDANPDSTTQVGHWDVSVPNAVQWKSAPRPPSPVTVVTSTNVDFGAIAAGGNLIPVINAKLDKIIAAFGIK